MPSSSQIPGMTPGVAAGIQLLEQLAKIKPRTPEEAAQLEQARTQAMNQVQGMSEGFDQDRGPTTPGDWREPDPISAPWRGEYDMPGNFERRQTMANSLAADEALRQGLSYQYKAPKEGELTRMDIQWEGGLAGAAYYANAIDKPKGKQVYYSGPELSQGMMRSPWNYRNWDPSGKQPLVLTEGQDRTNQMLTEAYLRRRGGQ